MKRLISLLLALSTFCSSAAFSCPRVAGLPDVNCDGSAKIAVLGDSVVYGTGDTINGGKGGYVQRISKSFPRATFFNLGAPGSQVRRQIISVEESFAGKRDSSLATTLASADVVILDLGRNDWWKFGPAIATWRDLKRLRKVIQSKVFRVTGHKPFVVTAQLMGANRAEQAAWVIELNKHIAAHNSPSAPTDLRFNVVNKRLLIDHVHPSPVGYDEIAKILRLYLRIILPKRIALFRPDTDRDGLYDEFEESKFGTSPNDPDTDDDGLFDGEDNDPV